MREPDKKRFMDAVAHVEAREIAFFECDPDITLVNAILGKDFPLSLHAYELPIPDYVELNRRMGNDMIYFAHIWRLGRKEKIDEAGRIHYVDGMMKTAASLKDVWYPDLGLLERRLCELCERIEGTDFGVVCSTQSAPLVVATAMGYQDYWLATLDRPGFVHGFTRTIQDWCIREAELLMQYPIDVLKIGSGFVTKTGPMCSPEMLEEFETRYLRECIDAAKARGLPVYFHMDGNVTGMLDKIIEMGVDVLNPLEPCDGAQDIYRIKEQYGGRLALCGNIDVNGVLLRGSPEEVKRDVREHVARLAQGGGYIVASSHDIHQMIPIENFFAMRDAAHGCA
jgi:hypothetical protein